MEYLSAFCFDSDRHSSTMHIPTPISSAPLPSAIPILRSLANDPRPDPQRTPPTATPSVFRTPSRTRMTNGDTASRRSMVSVSEYETMPSVPPTPGSFRSVRRGRPHDEWTVRRVSEATGRQRRRRRRRRPSRDDETGSLMDGPREENDDQRTASYATFPRQRSRNQPSRSNGHQSASQSPHAADEDEGTDVSRTDEEPPREFSLPGMLRSVSRRASTIFRRTPGRVSRAQSVWSRERERDEGLSEGVRMWYSCVGFGLFP